MKKRNIIVIGASAGGFEAIKKIAAALPGDLDASIFIVWHMSSDIRGILPQVLNRVGPIGAVHPVDGERVESNRIYVAVPDHHLVLDEGQIRITRGPKENRFRPAIDPLFRSAARDYRRRVIGVVLSGSLDDGSAGLWTVKNRGGLAVVQDPWDAEVASMPENAIRAVAVDHVVPVDKMADLLTRLSQEEVPDTSEAEMKDKKEVEKTDIEVRIAAQDSAFEMGVMSLGELTPFTCPDCHGVLSALKDGKLKRYRCHTGHAFSPDTLLATVTENIEESLWSTIRGIEESVMLLNHFGDHFAEINNGKLAASYFRKANDAHNRIRLLREAVMSHEQLSTDGIARETDAEEEVLAKKGNGGSRVLPAA